jgi:hypothetical protein
MDRVANDIEALTARSMSVLLRTPVMANSTPKAGAAGVIVSR